VLPALPGLFGPGLELESRSAGSSVPAPTLVLSGPRRTVVIFGLPDLEDLQLAVQSLELEG
jgi:hypothetical protein